MARRTCYSRGAVRPVASRPRRGPAPPPATPSLPLQRAEILAELVTLVDALVDAWTVELGAGLWGDYRGERASSPRRLAPSRSPELRPSSPVQPFLWS